MERLVVWLQWMDQVREGYISVDIYKTGVMDMLAD